MRGLRGRLTAGITLVLALVLVLAGVVVARSADATDRRVLDDRLRRTAELSRATALQALQRAVPEVDPRLDAVLSASDSSLRLVVGGQVLIATGRALPRGTPAPRVGLRTVHAPSEDLRVYAERVPDLGLGDLALLEVTTGLRGTEDRQRDLRLQLAGLGALVLLLAAAGTWLTASGVLRPLRRLRTSTAQIATEADLSRRVPETGARELSALAGDFNAMLERLERSAEERLRALEATRRFAADAGHELRSPLTAAGTTLDVLARHTDLDPERRAALAGEALAELGRLVALLDGLQALARGEAAEVPDRPVDVADLVDAAVIAARSRHPEVVYEADLPEGEVIVTGWEPGLRLVADNLLENAARHGRPGGGRVRVALRAVGPGHAELVVDDDGPGIAPADRERVLRPFERVEGPEVGERPGSGLGLALVAQQAAHHGGAVAIEQAPELGGARLVVSL